MFIIREVNSEMPSKYRTNAEKKTGLISLGASGFFPAFVRYLESILELTSLMMNIWFEICRVTYKKLHVLDIENSNI